MSRWESIDWATTRLWVHGGWLVKYIHMDVATITFVSDPAHEWRLL